MDFDIKIIRTARKSFSLFVSSENEVVLRCPNYVSESRINSFIDSKTSWLNNVLSKNEIKLALNKSVREYNEIFVGGEKYQLIISDNNEISENKVYIKSLKHIKNLFISHFKEKFISFAEELSRSTNLYANDFSIKAYRRRWGCCDSKGRITFNYLLFMLPKQLQRYIIIHELCHTVYFNHSANFWHMVKKFEPDYKNLRAQLKSFDYITNLY